ncbi:acetyl/propionyl/methylcrotonyl-CoA carboxylase subunit alpha [Sphingomonas sp. CFBP9019]|uniref:acetyl/propionyl/methylcrotonyl-CoA carboxylase subunit alpha n=3 Tax=unclassified Sphingomonas TaxID=196159 RepID=UPI002A6A2C9F|nr:acetyl/propionyl/methylcrotonyl-CoA carboxylase subunit alpha [Sphingomonas sp. CFBP9019]MDY1009383.1 acetyl/propionyl/methylcrotonyl-CoA carboxylase subunit alpha [Sphingomonas sp. CFBP9019]
MFKKILVANRGEIACRVMRTAKAMGIKTVAVYSDADVRSPHVLMADESVRLGPAPAAESYLKAELILLAAKETGADCIHPGYGFLSERESFARACAEAGIAFVGPPPAAIAAMGDKIESKKLAKAAGVNVVPGYLGEIADTDEAVRIAGDIGYPVMMKASAGGGGKGMRLAYSEQDVREGFEATKREGLASFGDDRVFIEKFIESPRHIEIQLIGDQHGNIVYLNERECSIQRRHQKVVEEAPSPFVTPKMRKAMGEQAVALARAVGYYSAGTVELIVSGADTSGEGFYFLEMNTRLQVEHPVTEEITGLDLVELMIRVAAGEPLGFAQDEVKLNGWSIENRVYAEDPYRGFLPSIGRLVRYNPPLPFALSEGASTSLSTNGGGDVDSAEPRVRVDDGVREGGEVSMFYDPMIAKLITWAPTREGAVAAQIAALDAFELEGPGNNIDFLSAIMQHPRFQSGALTTGFIAEEYPDGFHGAPADAALLTTLAAVAAFAATAEADRARRIDGQLGRRLRPPADWVVTIGGTDHRVRVSTDGISVDGEALDLSLEYTPGDRMVMVEGDEHLTIRIAKARAGFRLTTRGASHVARVLPARVAPYTAHLIEKVAPDLSKFLICPMPGLLVRLDVAAGDRVEAGQALAVVEAMKMENILRAEKTGVVKSVSAAAGDSLAVDQVILELE